MKHKHAELIKKWADGEKIEKNIFGMWNDCPNPNWSGHEEYRVKPKATEDFAVSACVTFKPQSDGSYLEFSKKGTRNVEFLFDGPTQKLKGIRRMPE